MGTEFAGFHRWLLERMAAPAVAPMPLVLVDALAAALLVAAAARPPTAATCAAGPLAKALAAETRLLSLDARDAAFPALVVSCLVPVAKLLAAVLRAALAEEAKAAPLGPRE